jgi:hypothetical protein
MFYRNGFGDKHNRHRDHGFNDDKWTVCFSPHADECKHTGSWDSQRVKPRRAKLAVEKEVTRVPSDGQWICFTPWSNAVNTHLWGFGKVPRAPHAAPLASAVSSGRWQASNFAGATDGPDASRLGLQLVFVIGAGQPRLFVEWLVTELMR